MIYKEYVKLLKENKQIRNVVSVENIIHLENTESTKTNKYPNQFSVSPKFSTNSSNSISDPGEELITQDPQYAFDELCTPEHEVGKLLRQWVDTGKKPSQNTLQKVKKYMQKNRFKFNSIYGMLTRHVDKEHKKDSEMHKRARDVACEVTK
ncbi:MAG: hypothetical protein LBP31_03330 [Holosporales bacterium]|nr:hypothetical protein [Holosporales bacterium]